MGSRLLFLLADFLYADLFFLTTAHLCYFVVRCSTSPLLTHPFTAALRATWSKFSADAVLDFIAGPSDSPGAPIKTPLDYRGDARRLQQPTFTAFFAQFLISAISGLVVAYTSVLPFSPTGAHVDF